ncbi:MAG: 4Fe-4S dicluster domain-containing protein [Clostridia bacterium]|nr:4Fe-4S dicluster domain-containing protein [Clostridia bacterium]
MKKFDTKVQHLKYKVLREVATEAWEDRIAYTSVDIPHKLAPGKKPTISCCVYKERAILSKRVKLALGGNRENKKPIEIIDIACDECPSAGYEITSACRGCLANHCEDVCKVGAIYFDVHHVAHIDKSKCVECGRCAKVCPYYAIINRMRPCQVVCKAKAVGITESKELFIDYDKCISCGACVYQCPFGAICDKSYILNVIDLIKTSDGNSSYKVYAMVAPSIASQFTYAKIGQVVSGLKEMGFYGVIEAALGADMVALNESRELAEKGFLISSCCPSFVDYVKNFFPDLKQHISHNPSPMITLAKVMKDKDPDCKIVFIGPCTAKKDEYKKPEYKGLIDSVITFEELQALFDSLNIEICDLKEDTLDDASFYGRIFARSGGLSQAVEQALKEQNIDFNVNPIVCNGIDECKMALLRKSKNALDANFIEGMACVNGCIGGAGCLTHGEQNKKQIDDHGEKAKDKTILSSLENLK